MQIEVEWEGDLLVWDPERMDVNVAIVIEDYLQVTGRKAIFDGLSDDSAKAFQALMFWIMMQNNRRVVISQLQFDIGDWTRVAAKALEEFQDEVDAKSKREIEERKAKGLPGKKGQGSKTNASPNGARKNSSMITSGVSSDSAD
jgi:hypothetical protein